MKFISSSKKSNKKWKKSHIESGKDRTTEKKSVKKRKVIFHKSKINEASPVERVQDGPQYIDDAILEKKKGQIKKVEFSQPSILQEQESEEIINLRDSEGQSLVKETDLENHNGKIEMIDSERLSVLLSSKKKHRYQNIQDSMDGMVDINIHQQINFTEEEENLKIKEYHSPGVDSPMKPDQYTNHISNIHHSQSDIGNITEDGRSIEEDMNQFKGQNIHPEKEYVLESITCQQIQDEQNHILEDVQQNSESLTVINCTQSDEEVNSELPAEQISDMNVIINDFSIECSKPQEPQGIIHEKEKEPEPVRDIIQEIMNERVFNYKNDEHLKETEVEEAQEKRSGIEFKLNQERSEPNYYPDSNESYSDSLINDGEIDDFLNEEISHKQDNIFENTLTNMRLAFGSEQHIRENSVKTLEKIENSQKDSGSGKKTEEKSSIFEKKSFQDFSLKRFTELMNVKNMKNFQNSMQKTFREYNKVNILSVSDQKLNNRKISTPKKSSCISPRKFSMKDLELDRIGYEKMKENSEKKSRFIQNIMGSSSSQNKHSHTSIIYNSNLSLDHCRKEINMQDISEGTSSARNVNYIIASPKKSYKLLSEKLNKEDGVREPTNLKTYYSPEPSKSFQSMKSSSKKKVEEPIQWFEQESVDETPYEDDNIETVKLDSSRLRSQKRGLSMDEEDTIKEETPKGTNTQRRIFETEENCYTGEKYILGDCFTDEKIYEMKLRNAVTSSKKINPIQILRDLKSPGSSYISSAKKALADGLEFDENDKIHFEISEQKEKHLKEFNNKENMRDNGNILVEKFDDDSKEDNLKNFINANKFQLMEQDYNELESPEKSHHKHSKSRSRTKEKRRNFSDGESENFEMIPIEGFEEGEDNTWMMIDFNNNSPEPKRKEEIKEVEETSKSIEWIIANNIDKKKRDEINNIIGEDSK